MICPKCGREQIKPSKFCTYCGAQMDIAASTAVKAGAVGLTTKIAIGAAGVCLAAGVGAVGLHMRHNWGAGKAVVAEKESGENNDETSEEKLAENADETSAETVDASAESDETENVDEINREAVAAYRKYVLEKRELPIENGGISTFSVIDLNNDGIFEMIVDNSNMEGSCTAYNRDTFIWYADGKIHELSLYPGVFFINSNVFAVDGERVSLAKCLEKIRCIETDRLYEQTYKPFTDERPNLDAAFRKAGYQNATIAYFYDPSAAPNSYSDPIYIYLIADGKHYQYYIQNGKVIRRVAPEAITSNVEINFFLKALIEDGAAWHEEGGLSG